MVSTKQVTIDTTPTPSQSINTKSVIQQGYDKVAPEYLAWSAPRPTTTRQSYLERLFFLLPVGARVLELGCGAGVPSTQLLLSHGMNVTGVDISSAQIELAKLHVPEATLIHADMMDLSFPGETYDAVVAFYSIFHLPREEQGIMVQRIQDWLKDGGWFLCNFVTEEGDVWREDWFKSGVKMGSFGLGVPGNRDLMATSELIVVEDELALEKVGRVEERFHWFFAKKPGGNEVHESA
jgi:ubiquinone/menaquinone biosynthesis C-methylase UbiE